MIIKIVVPDCYVYEKDLMNGFMRKFKKLVSLDSSIEVEGLLPPEQLYKVERAIRAALQKFVVRAFISYDHHHLDEDEQETFLSKVRIVFSECVWDKDEGKASWYWFPHADDFIVL